MAIEEEVKLFEIVGPELQLVPLYCDKSDLLLLVLVGQLPLMWRQCPFRQSLHEITMDRKRYPSLIEKVEELPSLLEWVGLQLQKVGYLACLNPVFVAIRLVADIDHQIATKGLHKL